MRRSQPFTSTVAEVARLYLMPVENGANLMTEVVTNADEHNVVLADNVRWRHRFDIRQHIQHLLIR